MKILNLYSGLGGNRKLWGESHAITSVEIDNDIAAAYRKNFPNDTVIIADAHEFLLHNYADYDFIWSSPPCPSHGQCRFNLGFKLKGYKALFPDMKLYEEILFLKHYFQGKWVVENVKPYYTPLVTPDAVLARHFFWSNFTIPNADFRAQRIRDKSKISDFADLGFDITATAIKNKRQALRNCVDSELGLHVLNNAILHNEKDYENGTK